MMSKNKILILGVGFFSIVSFGLYLRLKTNDNISKTQNKEEIKTPALVEEKPTVSKTEYFSSDRVFSLDDQTGVYFGLTIGDEVILSGHSYPLRLPDTSGQKDKYALFEKKIEKLVDTNYSNDTSMQGLLSKERIAVNTNGSVIAFAVPEELVVFTSKNGREVSKQNFLIPVPLCVTNRIFFSGDESEIYLVCETRDVAKPTNTHHVFKLDLETAVFKKGSESTEYPPKSANGPIPGQKGYTFWSEVWQKEEDGGRKQLHTDIVLHQGTKDTSYQLFGENNYVDYLGKIMLSPNSGKVCVENGSSGYWGYYIYDLRTKSKIEAGPQYSYCERWLDNSRLVIMERVYNHSDANPHYYVFDTITKKKELILITQNKF